MSAEAMTPAATPKPKRVKRKKSKAVRIIEWILFIVFGGLCAVVIAGNIQGMVTREEHYGQSIRFGVGSFIVLTDSMEPEIKQNDAIITFAQDVTTFQTRLDKGENIDITFVNVAIPYAFEPDTPRFKTANGGQKIVTNQVMTHRLYEVHEDTSVPLGSGRFIFVTAGINHQGNYSLMGQYQAFTEKQFLGVVILKNGALGQVFNFITSPIGLILLLLIPAIYLIVVSSMDIFKALKETENAPKANEPVDGRLSNMKDSERERLKKELLEEMIKARREQAKAQAEAAKIEQSAPMATTQQPTAPVETVQQQPTAPVAAPQQPSEPVTTLEQPSEPVMTLEQPSTPTVAPEQAPVAEASPEQPLVSETAPEEQPTTEIEQKPNTEGQGDEN